MDNNNTYILNTKIVELSPYHQILQIVLGYMCVPMIFYKLIIVLSMIKGIQLEIKLVLLAVGNSRVFDTLFTIV